MSTTRLVVVVGVVLLCVLPARAEVVLTVNGLTPSDLPLMPLEGKFTVAIGGDTAIKPSDVSLKAEGGLLSSNQDGNDAYHFEIWPGVTEAVVRLITRIDVVIDGRQVSAETTIYELYFLPCPDAGLVAVCGVGLNDLLARLQSTKVAAEVEAAALADGPAVTQVSTEAVSFDRSAINTRRVLLHCPNSVSAVRSFAPGRTTAAAPPVNNLEMDFEEELLDDEGGGGGCFTMGTQSIIDIGSDITTNQIWTADNIYHIVADISVQALLAIEPGTVVTFAPGYGLFVNNGGALISAGTPDEPIVYTSDAAYPDYGDYYCAIFIEETASPATKITYSYIEYASGGIVIFNKRLEHPVENNYLYNNSYGIVEFGTEHTDIVNNLIYGTQENGIEVHMASYTGQADANSHITIQNNTCDYYQNGGIVVYGVDNEQDAGVVRVVNNIVSEAYTGLYMLAPYESACLSIVNTGYYGNTYDRNWDFPEENPVIETDWPYVDGTGWLPVCYLKQDCNFINAGYEYVEGTRLIGKTTDVNSQPDCNYTDLGFHYANWGFSNPGSGDSLSADLDDDLTVNLRDFAVFANYWRQLTSAEADLDDTGYVDYADLALLADQWLNLADPNLQIHTYGDSNDGYVEVGVAGFTEDTLRVFLLVDGQYANEFFFFRDGKTIDLDVSALGPGAHELKAVSESTSGKVVCSNITQASFDCPLTYSPGLGAYESNEPYHFCGFYAGTGNITVKVYDEDANLVWSQTYSAQNLNGFVPASVTSRDDLDRITFELAGGGAIVAKPLAVTFIPGFVRWGTRALLVLPDLQMNILSRDVVKALESTFKARGVSYCKLKLWNAKYENLAWLGMNRDIQYLYYAGHGKYKVGDVDGVGGVLRTNILLWDLWAVSAKRSDFAPGYAPPWCEELPGSYEQTPNSIFKIWSFPGLIFAHLDCCHSGHLRITSDNRLVEGPSGNVGMLAGPYSDMSYAFGMHGGFDQFCHGWWGEVWKGSGMPINKFDVDEWTQLEEGEDLYSALLYAVNRGETEALDNLRVYGTGLMTAVRIE